MPVGFFYDSVDDDYCDFADGYDDDDGGDNDSNHNGGGNDVNDGDSASIGGCLLYTSDAADE